jgi:alpha-beta hydrolase superfamily lysophospholipase
VHAAKRPEDGDSRQKGIDMPARIALAAAAALLLAACGSAGRHAHPAGSAAATITPASHSTAPGALLSATRVTSIKLDPPATIWRILYRSRTRTGADVVVSGFAVVPAGPAPAGGRPVYAWAHGTAGQGDQCAPSRDIRDNLPPEGAEAVMAGAVIVATDYDGLGTPGTPTYYDGVAEGRAVLDSARAARSLPGVGRLGPVLIAGHSQGGAAALFAAQIAHSYAPDLDVLGVVAMAPGSNLVAAGSAVAASEVSGLILIAADGLHAAYPALDPASFLTPDAVRDLARVEHECVNATLSRWRGRNPLRPNSLSADPLLRAVLAANSPGAVDPGVPILIVQGDQDEQIPVGFSALLAQRYCADGATVHRVVYPGVDHEGVLDASHDDVTAWLTARLAGSPAPDDCSP